MLPVIVGCSSTRLSKGERACFEEFSPAGFILFAHNIQEPSQVRDLCAALHAAACARAPRACTAILIDQEGGRVQRLRPPHWRGFPAARAFGDCWQQHGSQLAVKACRASARLMGEELADLGITVNCAPVADLPSEGADSVIGDRAFASSLKGVQDDCQARVASLARAQAEGLLDAGILPIVKHVPGHGRATCDSHKGLPRVMSSRADLAKSDFACFLALRDLPMMMTAHILYNDIDSDAPATLSRKTIDNVVRGAIGFQGLLISDDLRMKALQGKQRDLAIKALAAGCDLALYCGSRLTTTRAIAECCAQEISPRARATLDKALDKALGKALDFAARQKKAFSAKEKQDAEELLTLVETHNKASDKASV